MSFFWVSFRGSGLRTPGRPPSGSATAEANSATSVEKMKLGVYGSFPKLGGTFLGVLIIRIIMYQGLC